MLGSVEARVGMLSTAPCSLAPLVFLPLAYHLFLQWPVWLPVSGMGVVGAYLRPAPCLDSFSARLDDSGV